MLFRRLTKFWSLLRDAFLRKKKPRTEAQLAVDVLIELSEWCLAHRMTAIEHYQALNDFLERIKAENNGKTV